MSKRRDWDKVREVLLKIKELGFAPKKGQSRFGPIPKHVRFIMKRLSLISGFAGIKRKALFFSPILNRLISSPLFAQHTFQMVLVYGTKKKVRRKALNFIE